MQKHSFGPTIVRFLSVGMVVILGFAAAAADGPADNRSDAVRRIPPPGIELDVATTETLLWRCQAVRTQWQTMADDARQKGKSAIDDLASEVLVFPRSVEMAIEFGQFHKPKDIQSASQLLDEAARRLKVIQSGGDWADVVGVGNGSSRKRVIGGYPSKIDGSFQPYGLVLPAGLSADDARPRRLDLWFHGRGETQSEVAFLTKQTVNAGEYTPADTIVLHPYGRYCNAFKFAGEVDVLEALAYVQSRLPVDDDRISVRGFSMGGAACWQFATRYADRWFAANPGAGFSETPEFLNFFQGEDVRTVAPEYQQQLWNLYDCPAWAINLKHCPTVAYSGEIDRQKQAADVMQAALEAVGINMTHIIGPQTAHKIHPDSKVEIEAKMESLARLASRTVPKTIDFTTVTLRYHTMHWVDVRGLGRHWSPATVRAQIMGRSQIHIDTDNVTALNLEFAAGQWPGESSGPITVTINGHSIRGPLVQSDRSWKVTLVQQDDRWEVRRATDGNAELRKKPGLQGPIDDALMDSFYFVLPSGQSTDPVVQNWVSEESAHAMEHWRIHFRGDVRRVVDTELTEAQIASSNLLLFGDPDSNAVIARIADQLPVRWTDDSILLGDQSVPRTGHVPILVFPNPLNPDRYVVINSGFTFREYDYLNNARQTPKLPDWALVDITGGPTMRDPGKIRAAGFFDEKWKP